ncbi:MAG: hypothetical protein F4W92_00740 [Gammaproteobacteria bacterium]|nr:hypothetical protein [Gammaproteobacteria bacterium]
MNKGSRNRSGCGGEGSASDTPRFTKTAQKLDAGATAVAGVSLDRFADLRYQLSRKLHICMGSSKNCLSAANILTLQFEQRSQT